MKRQVSANDLTKQMIEACISHTQKSKRGKELEKICNLLLKQLTSSNPEKVVQVNVVVASGKSAESNQTFLLQCFLWILMKFKELRVCISMRVGASRSRTSSNVVDLILGSTDLVVNSSFFQILQKLKPENSPKEISHFFKELSFSCIMQNKEQMLKNQGFKHIPAIYNFISQIYQHIKSIFPNKNVYFDKNSLAIYSNQDLTLEENTHITVDIVQSKIQLIKNFKSLYSLQWSLKGFQTADLKEFSMIVEKKQHQNQGNKHEEQIPKGNSEKVEIQEKNRGFFKEFYGSQNQFLEIFNFIAEKHFDQIAAISNLLIFIPNLSILNIVYKQGTTIRNVEPLLESIIENTPLISIVMLVNSHLDRAQILPNSLLLKVYEECPFLIQLDIGLSFQFSISQTFMFTGPEERQNKEREREAQIILEALRLRNLTLSHNYEMAKLLLKKKFTFISTLEIVDCIDMICF